MRDFQKMLRMAAMNAAMEDIEDNIEKVRKSPNLIFAEAKLTGRDGEIEHLHECVSAFHSEVVKKDEQFEKANETIDKLRAREDELDEEVQGLTSNNDRLAEQKESLAKGLEKMSQKNRKRKEIILWLINARGKAENEIANLPKRPTKTDLQNAILAIQKILDKPIANDPDGAGTTADQTKTANDK